MLPAPTTIATSTPASRTSLTWRATAATRSGSVPNSSSPIRASPESFKRMRLKTGIIARGEPTACVFWGASARASAATGRDGRGASMPRVDACSAADGAARGLLADGEAHEAADDDVLAGLRGELVAQLLDGLALELRVVQLLLEQHDRPVPGVELALDDFRAQVFGLVGGLLLVDARLGVAGVGGNLLAADVAHGRRRRDLHRDVARETDEVLVGGDEVGVAVDLDQHPDLGAGVHVGLYGALGRGALAEVLDLLALAHA